MVLKVQEYITSGKKTTLNRRAALPLVWELMSNLIQKTDLRNTWQSTMRLRQTECRREKRGLGSGSREVPKMKRGKTSKQFPGLPSNLPLTLFLIPSNDGIGFRCRSNKLVTDPQSSNPFIWLCYLPVVLLTPVGHAVQQLVWLFYDQVRTLWIGKAVSHQGPTGVTRLSEVKGKLHLRTWYPHQRK